MNDKPQPTWALRRLAQWYEGNRQPDVAEALRDAAEDMDKGTILVDQVRYFLKWCADDNLFGPDVEALRGWCDAQ